MRARTAAATANRKAIIARRRAIERWENEGGSPAPSDDNQPVSVAVRAAQARRTRSAGMAIVRKK
jgi:hypothetical protein